MSNLYKYIINILKNEYKIQEIEKEKEFIIFNFRNIRIEISLKKFENKIVIRFKTEEQYRSLIMVEDEYISKKINLFMEECFNEFNKIKIFWRF